MSTYVTLTHEGREFVMRTDLSRARAVQRKARKALRLKIALGPDPRTAQDVADEKHLSRSKPYPVRGSKRGAK